MADEPDQAASAFADYFAMGGYAGYIWPAYAVALLGLAGLTVWSIVHTRALERRAARLRRQTGAEDDQ